jgi:hypothetical protein
MRLTPVEQKSLHDASVRWFGVPPPRVDDEARGGGIGLYIEAALPAHDTLERGAKMAAALYRALGECKIDNVVNTGWLDLPICRVARDRGMW